MEGEIKNLFKVWLSVLASLCYSYFLASKISSGKLRLISLVPIFFLFTILPLHLSYAFPIGLITLSFSWLCNFKLLLFAFDKGPLPNQQFLHFLIIACLPIKENRKTPQIYRSSSPKLPLNWPGKVLIFAVLVSAHDYEQFVHPKIVLLVYCCMVYLLIDVIFGLVIGVVRAASGLELEPPSDEPYLSTSLQDFWGRRWNLAVTDLLRHTVYKPVRSFFDVLGPDWAQFLAVVAAFVVSGLMHELLFYYVKRASPSWEMTWFFVLHGVCVAAEMGVKRAVSGRVQLHPAVSTPLTVGFVVATAMWLFFPPLLRTGAVEKALEECKVVLEFSKSLSEVIKGRVFKTN
ncbi:hypothetical protein like AT5G55360 [Hibiscus trionum]|uniref:Wax synthase domain-containing protein n=1 Tax=Hibiscus trionum TaxID=183268 RepID=A0A9W7MV06_HIBTR|nr:hypothetical protein like AT5G55360 [Hibiscus trionum]